jgi:uncharacterized glyoxalase superfamily protein PhnB
MPAAEYGRSLPAFTVNLVVAEVARAVEFYRDVLGAKCHYADEDFAALAVHGAEVMLHADHTYDAHPWYGPLSAGERRGLGAEMRIFGMDPDATEAAAKKFGSVVVQTTGDKPHGWREVMVADPDGYVWAVGVAT